MTSIHFTVYGKAEPAGSKTAGVTKTGRRFVRDANPSAAAWKAEVKQAAGKEMQGRSLLEGPIRLTVQFERNRPRGHYGTGRNEGSLRTSAPKHPTTKPDTTKLVRAIEDAMTGTVYRDDAQIVMQRAWKTYTTGSACVRVSVEELPDDRA